MKAKDLVVGTEYALVNSKSRFEQGSETPARVVLLSDKPHVKPNRYARPRDERTITTEKFGDVTVNAKESSTGWSGAGALVGYVTDDDVYHSAVVTLSKFHGEYAPVMAEYREIRARWEDVDRTRAASQDDERARSEATISRIEAIIGRTDLSPTGGALNVPVSVLEALLDAAEANR